jgi:hypothetical protein
LPLLAVGMAGIGYVAIRLFWRLYVMWKWHKHHEK